MSWNIKEKLRGVLKMEEGAVVKEWGGKTSVALVCPNVYRVGMGNLAVHVLYKILSDRKDIVCERFFLPSRQELLEYKRTGTPILSLESQRPLSDFDVVAFTISYENDHLNILPILELAKIPYKKDERIDSHPVLIAGGAAPTLNPRPISKIFDAVFLGEVECFSDRLVSLFTERLSRSETIAELKKMECVSQPLHLKNLNEWKTQSYIYSAHAEFGDMHLIEVQRGCPHKCRFCATPYIYGKARHRSFDAITAMIDDGIKKRKRFGLIGAHILSLPSFVRVAETIHSLGATFSPSSVRVDDIDEKKAELLSISGHRSIALGIEAAEEKLRNSLYKGISDAQIFEAVEILAKNSITNLRLYFMIGLPLETDEDIEDIAKMSCRIKEILEISAPKKARSTSVDITVSPFVPKPHTPFASAKFAGVAEIKRKIARLKKMTSREKGISLKFDSPMAAEHEAYFASAGEEAIEVIEEHFRSPSFVSMSPSA